jgi:methylated-DNA-[protein]-cysteine S-methyltransferase
MIIECSELASPVGRLTLAVAGSKLVALCFEGHWQRRHESLKKSFPSCSFASVPDPASVATRLRRYFDGDLAALATVEVELRGTPFQVRAWEALRRIPVGQTRTYAEQAVAIGAPAAVRAIGTANGANPVAIVVPCHRVIGSNGTLTGFGGGLPRKQWLLDHEGAQLGMFAAAPSRSGRRAA